MQPLILNANDGQGGAARAVCRLHQGLREIGYDSKMLVRVKSTNRESILSLDSSSYEVTDETFGFQAIQKYYINLQRTALSNTLFSFPYPSYDVSQLPIVQAADVINLHWVAGFQSPQTIKKLADLGKPIVWTLHDMWAFTGGCHYAAGCDRYQMDCQPCPQLQQDPHNLPATVLQDKYLLWSGLNLTIVTPSRWLADCAKQSRLFKNYRVEVIGNSLETDLFQPTPKDFAKQKLGIAPDVFTILLGAGNGNERRKGFAECFQAIQHCLEDSDFLALAKAEKVQLLSFGLPNKVLSSLPLRVTSLGEIRSDEMLSQVYSAANLFVLPSLEDNLPNTMLEAMACGTPVLGFEVGGLPDVIEEGVTGWLVPLGAIKQMGQVILDCVRSPQCLSDMEHHCRTLMESNYGLPVQATRYAALFEDLLRNHQPAADSSQVLPVATLKLGDLADQSAQLNAALNTTPSTEIHLTLTRAALRSVIAQLKECQTSLANVASSEPDVQSDIETKLKNRKAQLQKVKEKLQTAEAKIEELAQELTAIKTSKFWKARSLWIKFKLLLNFKEN